MVMMVVSGGGHSMIRARIATCASGRVCYKMR
jgi:hypothetical protein